MIGDIKKEEVKEFCREKGMQWKFITPVAPHQNGCAEALVKNMQECPRKLLAVKYQGVNLVKFKSGRIPNDLDDNSYICPGEILLGCASSEIPQGPFKGTKNPCHRLEFVPKIIDSF